MRRVEISKKRQRKMTYEHEQLNTLLTAFLTDFDMSDVRQEIDKIKREQVNWEYIDKNKITFVAQRSHEMFIHKIILIDLKIGSTRREIRGDFE